MGEPDDFLDDDAATANRHDTRNAVVVTLVALASVLVVSALVVVGGVTP